jgi:hypothetical protein
MSIESSADSFVAKIAKFDRNGKTLHCDPAGWITWARPSATEVAAHDWPLTAMTVHERLAALGLLGAMHEAIRSQNRNAMLVLLERVEVANPPWMAGDILRHPSGYGF